MVSHILNGLLFFPLFGCHMALRATYRTTFNTLLVEAPWIYQPIRMWVIILKGMEMKGNTVCDMWVRFKVGGVSAALGPAD